MTNIEQQYIGVCSLLARLYKPIQKWMPEPQKSDYTYAIQTALDDFEKVLDDRFEVWRSKIGEPYAIEPKYVSDSTYELAERVSKEIK